MTKYQTILTETEIAAEEYKKLLGGGPSLWNQRGAAQLNFLINQGMVPASRLLDIGCGPMRAGCFFIEYLDAGNYVGFDYNASFVVAAEIVIREKKLEYKKPTIRLSKNFLVDLPYLVDFGIAFSVLNHCDRNERLTFFQSIGAAFRPAASLFVSHARWFHRSYLSSSKLRLKRIISPFDCSSFDGAWTDHERRYHVFPILEFTV